MKFFKLIIVLYEILSFKNFLTIKIKYRKNKNYKKIYLNH